MNRVKTVAYYQHLVDQTIQALGGYWRPLSGLARLLEELGELNELLLQEQDSKEWQEKLEGELTDLFVISTCLAHQYCGDLEEEYTQLGLPINPEEIYHKLPSFSSSTEGVLHIAAQSGQIGRILNHYEGDKKKKPTEKHRRLSAEVALLHHFLLRFANTLQVRLFDHVESTLSYNLQRDKNRFDLTDDPMTERSRINYIAAKQAEGKLETEKIWGARPWRSEATIEDNVQASLPTVARWLKCGEAEQIAGVVFEIAGCLGKSEQLQEELLLKIKEQLSKYLELDWTTLQIVTYRTPGLNIQQKQSPDNRVVVVDPAYFIYLTPAQTQFN